MSLNIKNEATHRRAKELARIAGETMTEAVDRAITERLERLRKGRNRAALVARLNEIGEHCSKLPVLDSRSPEEMLYDEHGCRSDCRGSISVDRHP
jgi:antitoxin VapB